ncbi:type II toxin-antitoxin system RelE/ParE family toxin [Asticcacaulis sp. YBE204]|uniref:type II toxin-antitoxin system RelE/ParE family toxin n=1 Tax=Asticcacaulis sp. YBE204 TaxID=1282363 RepID=UPI0003C3F52A|nr:type II toxin-antitoxin system RelE/ParE family toxin [Asticcacaulis sp. YBE204]ESQ78251.1 hypothetical protein AEYBE204_15550 [Asticcacaulis sp. YBE204]
MRLIFATAARDDLRSIGEYIAEDNPTRAITFVAELVTAAKALIIAPYAFALMPRYERSGIRRKPYKRYVIFYRVEDNKIVVIHILNSAQDHEALLLPDT